MQRVVIFGAGKIAEAVTACAAAHGGFEILAYATDPEFVGAETFLGRPLLSFDNLGSKLGPDCCALLVAVGHQAGNQLRAEKVAAAKERGYRVTSLIGARAIVPDSFQCGENSVVFDGAVVQPAATVGANVFIWGGAAIGHHSHLEDDCWVAGGASIGGGARIGRGAFVGMGAVVGHEVDVGDESILGAGTLTTRTIGARSVVVKKDTEVHRLDSHQFLRLTRAL